MLLHPDGIFLHFISQIEYIHTYHYNLLNQPLFMNTMIFTSLKHNDIFKHVLRGITVELHARISCRIPESYTDILESTLMGKEDLTLDAAGTEGGITMGEL